MDRAKQHSRVLHAEEAPEAVVDGSHRVSLSTLQLRHLPKVAFFTAQSLSDKAWSCVPYGQPGRGSLW